MITKEWKYFVKISNKENDTVVLQRLFSGNEKDAEKEVENLIDAVVMDENNNELQKYDWLTCEIIKELIVNVKQ